MATSNSQGASGGSASSREVSEDKVEGSEDLVDDSNLQGAEGGKDSTEESDLGIEDESEEGSKQLGNNDSGKDSKEQRQEVSNGSSKISSFFLNNSTTITSSRRSISSIRGTISSIRGSIASVRGSISSWSCRGWGTICGCRGSIAVICKGVAEEGEDGNEVLVHVDGLLVRCWDGVLLFL